jgi:hypothetical protein
VEADAAARRKGKLRGAGFRPKRRRERACGSRRDDEPRDAVLVHERDAGGERRGDDGGARGLRLELHKPERLRAGHTRQAEDVGGSVVGGQRLIRDGTGEDNLTAKSKRLSHAP